MGNNISACPFNKLDDLLRQEITQYLKWEELIHLRVASPSLFGAPMYTQHLKLLVNGNQVELHDAPGWLEREELVLRLIHGREAKTSRPTPGKLFARLVQYGAMSKVKSLKVVDEIGMERNGRVMLGITDDSLQHLASLGHLQELDLTKLSSRVQITDRGIQSFMTSLKNLKKLAIIRQPRLTKTSLVYISSLPNLESLQIDSCLLMKQRGFLLLSALKLRQLYIKGSHAVFGFSEVSEEGSRHFVEMVGPGLKKLGLLECDFLTGEILDHVVTSMPQLEELIISGTWYPMEEGIAHLAPMKHLRILSLKLLKEVTTPMIANLIASQNLKALRVLSLSI